MRRMKTVKTPIGKIKIGPGVVPYEDATRSITDMEKTVNKLIKKGTVPAERLRDDDSTSRYFC